MRKIGLFEAKQKLSELVDRAERGERIGITRRGKLSAVIGPVRGEANLQQLFERLETIRARARKKKSVSTRQLIEEGRV